MKWKPVSGHIMTRWASDVSPDSTWPEYPRPQMTRKDWQSLNGLWDYRVDNRASSAKRGWEGKILVPFAIESALSGVKRPLRPDEILHYRREFSVPVEWHGKRILLHFEAVDWQANVSINGQWIGEHTGGYLPFSFDITDCLKSEEALNELTVSVWDPTDTHWQQRGKQVLKPYTTYYSAVSGIWQTVWLEPVPETYIAGLKIDSDIDTGVVSIRANLTGPGENTSGVRVRVEKDGTSIAEAENDMSEITVRIPDPELWSPDSPHLYDLVVSTDEDQVGSYFGMRKFHLTDGRICLNGKPLFQLGPLEQGYWPDGLYTPPSDEAMRHDIDLVKKLKFNMLRKHVKVEPRRYYSYCDRIGLIVWQDMPNGCSVVNDFASALAVIFGFNRRDRYYRLIGRGEQSSRTQFRTELREMVDHLYNSPCIGVWVPFNEGWGQFDAKEISDWLKKYDPSRLVDHASGWYDQGGGDCRSLHRYILPLRIIKPETSRAAVLSEFGGYTLNVDGHVWNPGKIFGYKRTKTSPALTKNYLNLLNRQLQPLIDAGLSAAIYTQAIDVEIEINGFVTYDRDIEKMEIEKISRVHKALIEGASTPADQ